MKSPKFTHVSLLLLAFFLFSIRPAHAYLDPGSGSYILQLLIGGGVGALFAIKTFWGQIKSFFTSLFNRKKNKPSSATKKKNGDQ